MLRGHFSSNISIRHSIASFKSVIANDDDMFHKLGSGLGFGLKFLNDKKAEELHSRIFVRCELCQIALMSLRITILRLLFLSSMLQCITPQRYIINTT